MTTYSEASAAAAKADETKDCAVKSVAVALDLDYQFTRGLFDAFGRPAKSPTPFPVTEKVLAHLDWHLTSVPYCGKRIREVERALPSTDTYLIQSTRHIHCFKNGKSEDWATGSRKLVVDVWKLEQWVCSRCGTRSQVDMHEWPTDPFFAWPDGPYFTTPMNIRLAIDVGLRYSGVRWRAIPVCSKCWAENPLEKRASWSP